MKEEEKRRKEKARKKKRERKKEGRKEKKNAKEKKRGREDCLCPTFAFSSSCPYVQRKQEKKIERFAECHTAEIDCMSCELGKEKERKKK